MQMDESTLAIATRHVAEGERIVAIQKLMIERLKAAGVSSLDAEQTLQVFETTLDIFKSHRDDLLTRQHGHRTDGNAFAGY
jgi:hypothetical protein